MTLYRNSQNIVSFDSWDNFDQSNLQVSICGGKSFDIESSSQLCRSLAFAIFFLGCHIPSGNYLLEIKDDNNVFLSRKVIIK